MASKELIMVTGATGFIGGHLLKALLNQTEKQTDLSFICPVRAANDLDAQARGRGVTDNPRVRFIAGDIESDRLGRTGADWTALAAGLREIYHCAASLTYDLPLVEAQRINVDGTAQMLELAVIARQQGTFQRLHYVSTSYLVGKYKGAVKADYLPTDSPSNFRNNYERSKARAERLLREQTQVPVSIYRPSIVTGHTVTGETDNWNVLYVPMRMIFRGALPKAYQGGPGLLDCVGIDYVVHGMLALEAERRMRDPHSSHESYHLVAGLDAFSISDVAQATIEEICKLGGRSDISCKIVGSGHWWLYRNLAKMAARLPLKFKSARRWGRLVDRGMRGFDPYASYCSVATLFDCERETAVLAAAGIQKPAPLEYLRTIIRYAIQVNFGTSPRSNTTKEIVKDQVSTAVAETPQVQQTAGSLRSIRIATGTATHKVVPNVNPPLGFGAESL